MKLVTFTESNSTRIGVAVDGGVVDLSKADGSLPRDMIGLITAWAKVKAAVVAASSRKADFALTAVTLQAPVPRPSKAMAIGLNYADHIAESGQKAPEEQVWFAKQVNSIHAPFADVQLPKASLN